MGVTRAYHRPLVSGIMVISAKKVGKMIQNIGGGTLTGLATRNSDGKKMLVTNLHVMTSSVQTNPSGNEEMYQMAMTDDRKVGAIPAWDADSPAWVPIQGGQQENFADVAMCELDENVAAEFTLHDHPSHSRRKIIEGVVDPVKDDENPMTLIMMGGRGGEGTVTVKEVNWKIDTDDRIFSGVTILDCSQRPVLLGDSGSACVYKVKDGQYRMSCIVFGRDASGLIGWAFPASVAERELDITFGNRAPIADAGSDWMFDTDDLVTLDGSRSRDPEGDTLTYVWTQTGGTPKVTLNSPTQDGTSATAAFTAPSNPAVLAFDLTVADSLGQDSTDTVTIRVIQTTAEEAVNKYDANNDGLIDKDELAKAISDYLFEGKASKKEVSAVIARHQESVPPSAPADLTATDGNARITLSWNDPDNSTITQYEYRLKPGANAWGSWTIIPGSGSATVTYVITGLTNDTAYTAEVRAVNVRGIGESAQAGPVTPSVPNRQPTPPPTETWGTWADTGSTQGCGPTKKKEQSRTSNLGNTQTRWLDSPEPETWGPWTDTGKILGSGAERVKEQSRTSSCDNRETRWVGDSDLH